MFKSLGADLLGTSDNCTPIRRDDKATAGDLMDFMLPRERPWIILASKVKQFIFTDMAFIFIENDNVGGTKRLVTRYDYASNQISDVRFEMAGQDTKFQ